MKKMKKTNAMRILESEFIAYEVDSYKIKEFTNAYDIALKMNIDPQRLFKTIVLKSQNDIFIALVDSKSEIDLKKTATLFGIKHLDTLDTKNIFKYTGYIRGCVTPIAMKKQYPTVIDKNSLNFDKIYISAGKKGYQIIINPKDLIKITGAVVYDVKK